MAVLNSKLGDYFIRRLGVTRNGGYFEYKPMFIEKLPVPIIPYEIERRFEDAVDTLFVKRNTDSATYEIENEINNMIYDLYHLTSEEIDFVKIQ